MAPEGRDRRPSHSTQRPDKADASVMPDKMSLAWRLICLVSSVHAVLQKESPFIEPTETSHNVEYYDSGTTRFAIFMTPVTWKEAHKLCPSRKGHLLEMQDDEIASFIGQALAESAVGFGSLWIGGEFFPSKTAGEEGEWKWIVTGKVIESKLENVNEFPMNSTPYWVDRPNITTAAALCLATDRKMHHLPLIVSQPCDRKRPYICALPGNGSTGPSVEVKPPVYVGGRRFHLFRSEATWEEALTQCRLIGMTLAKLTTELEFRMIRNRMLRSRPIMENAWIGGTYANGQWTWVSSNEPINIDPNKGNAAEPFAWYRKDNIIMEGCLLADRHVCDHFVYVEAKCNRRRPFICEEEVEGKLEPPVVPATGGYWISTYEETWDRAMNVCKVCLDGHLAHIDTTKEGVATELPILFWAMAIALRVEVRHAWIGGYLYNSAFKWTEDRTTLPGDDKLIKAKDFESIQAGGEKGTIVYCDVDFSTETYLLAFKCLNMDRENQKNFFMYGLSCYQKQYFICQTEPDVVLSEKCYGGGLETNTTQPVTKLTSPKPTTKTETTTTAPTTQSSVSATATESTTASNDAEGGEDESVPDEYGTSKPPRTPKPRPRVTFPSPFQNVS